MREIIQGEASVGQSTLSRFFALHVVVLPLLTLGLLGAHLFMVQLHGMSQGVEEKPRGTEKFFPFFLLKELSLWGVAFLGIAILALCLPFESFFSFPLFEPYDALGSTPEGIKPEWYFYFAYYPLEILPFWLVSLGMGAAVGGLFAAPWMLKRAGYRATRVIAAGVAGYILVISLLGEQIHYLVKGGP
jgi:quinol-cytochrome oxidoreductase complex cytochrome b subunit